jgi:hypothetical protein
MRKALAAARSCKRSPRPNQNLEDKTRQKAVQMLV